MPLGALPGVLAVGVLGVASLAGVVHTSLRPASLTGGAYGLDAWRQVLGDGDFARAVAFNLWVAATATVVSAVVALALALALRHGGVALRSSLVLPIATPHLVIAGVAMLWLGPGGLAERLLGTMPLTLTGDRWGFGIIIVYLVKEIPFLTLLALASLDDGTRELEDTAATLGAGLRRRLLDVILPRAGVPLAAGGLLVAAFVLGAVEVPLVIGPTRPDTIATYALGTVRIEGPIARAEAAAANAVAAGLVLVVATAMIALCRRHRLWSRLAT